MEKYYIQLKGTGQNNGVVLIDKKFEVQYNEVSKYTNSSTSKEYIQKALEFYYPGIKSHNVHFAQVITEKVKVPKSPDDFEKFIAGAATGYVVGKSKKSKNEPQHISSEYSFVDNIQGISEISFYTSDVQEIKTNLDKIFNEIIDFKWKSTGQDKDENKIIDANNRVLNMCVRNYATGLKKLKLLSNDAEENIHYDKQYKKLKRKRFFNKYGVYVYAGLGLILIMLILAAME